MKKYKRNYIHPYELTAEYDYPVDIGLSLNVCGPSIPIYLNWTLLDNINMQVEDSPWKNQTLIRKDRMINLFSLQYFKHSISGDFIVKLFEKNGRIERTIIREVIALAK